MLNEFTVHGTAIGATTSLQLDEISILATPQTLRELGQFLIHASEQMTTHGLEHLHLQDALKDFSPQQHVDFIALNKDRITPTKT